MLVVRAINIELVTSSWRGKPLYINSNRSFNSRVAVRNGNEFQQFEGDEGRREKGGFMIINIVVSISPEVP